MSASSSCNTTPTCDIAPERTAALKYLSKPVVKKDAYALLAGKPLYTDDIAPTDALVMEIIHSPHAHARIRSIDASRALKVPGVVAVFTYHDVPQTRFSLAGQSNPVASPYDRLILDPVLRYLGDEVALVVALDERTAERACRLVKVDYEVLPALLDFTQAVDNPVVVHDEDGYTVNAAWINNERERNICAQGGSAFGDLDAEFAEADVIIDRTYHTKANAQAMMETFRSFAYTDAYGRIVCVSSTQVPFHVRRMISTALEIPPSQVRVVKPRIGGGFGAKQTGCLEVFAAFAAARLGRPVKICYTREKTFTASNSRHEMQMHVRLGARRDGTIVAIDLDTLSNTGAYGEHGPTTVGLSGHKSLPLYNRALATRFTFKVVYTNTMPAGAYRGYGATQGLFALESAVNELADELHMDPCELRQMNLVHEGDVMPQFDGETLTSCSLDRCIRRAQEMIGWDEKGLVREVGNGRVRALGVALGMQGSCILNVDIGSVDLRLEEGGFYVLSIGATDMGTGCDTILAQFAAEVLECPVERIVTRGVDTDVSPYDTGSYASSTTYITGSATVKAATALREKMSATAASWWGVDSQDVCFDGERVFVPAPGGEGAQDMAPLHEMDLETFANKCVAGGQGDALTAHAAQGAEASPPPFMVGIAEVEVDRATGEVDVVDYVGVVDCGTVANTNLARIQAEGGIAQGIGMALTEDVQYSPAGRMRTRSFMTYKLPSRLDVPSIRVDFVPSYEASGPFGAKSIGEVVINTPAPAIASAVAHACGHQVRELPITPQKVLHGE
ncbi:molybdopterin cofactor-binding domain-containing protein [Collinsella sp. An2]|uniref:xanthine dehydrogenase family protein molybdopterin-binding subunit n=1 Tax=Collinsella sp. An2 TaxID=1965585 RepID=UPI000B3926A4|nr:molybdopterin cofactor-binding domain-containing protein [Collinsella sp. An2]OUP06263.1 aldehyde oxidase [Collinsella sp. An2]